MSVFIGVDPHKRLHAVVAVNDVFVMNAWAKASGGDGKAALSTAPGSLQAGSISSRCSSSALSASTLSTAASIVPESDSCFSPSRSTMAAAPSQTGHG